MRFIDLNHYDKSRIEGYQEFNEALYNENYLRPIEAKKLLMQFR